jgi:hypothetical protein
VLNHATGAKVDIAGTHNPVVYAAQKKAALEGWATHVEGVTDKRAEIVDPSQRVEGLSP